MVKRTLELFDCDKCGEEGRRYSVTYEDGTLIMDRCETHARPLEKLRTEPGQWVAPNQMGRNSFKKSSLTELRAAVEAARNRPEPVQDDAPRRSKRA